ncbi:MAG: hypothetical protein SOT71_11565 [Romboutsia timonensis]|uniref:hypothetical protein n=1 Tax=Romboutsia timonensis TaxID=1776391 RepID=UPI002A757798|nr:hypothetical protein [Romboutsia timonensis]MDY2883279.1 hypothetical protein [Romboutsia timonensis]
MKKIIIKVIYIAAIMLISGVITINRESVKSAIEAAMWSFLPTVVMYREER